MPLRYRVLGEAQWHEGRTENISRSGILFRTTDIVDLDVRVEMSFVLPILPAPPAILCRGRIVRTTLPGGNAHQTGVAATISRYRWRRTARPD
jgi:PilZ domain-containing protein